MIVGDMSMMGHVGPMNGKQVPGRRLGKPQEASMDHHVMHDEVRHAVGGDARADPYRDTVGKTSRNEAKGRRGEEQHEDIIPFERVSGRAHMVAAMHRPEESMHDDAMKDVREHLHANEGRKHDRNAEQHYAS